MLLTLLLSLSLAAMIVGLRDRVWWLLAVAAALSLLPGLGAHAPLWSLALLPLWQMAMAIALRWRLGHRGWSLALAGAAAVWAVGLAGPILAPDQIPVPLAGLVYGWLLVSVIMLIIGPARLATPRRPVAPVA